MKKIYMALFNILFASMFFSNISFAQDDFIFRNDNRPEYKKNISLDQLNEMQKNEKIVLLDVRLTEDFALDPILIPGAEYKNPENISKWASTLPKNKKIVLYCVKGAWVSQKAATYLDEQGYDVSTLNGGIQEWKAINTQ